MPAFFNFTYLWAGLVVLFSIVEIATTALVSIWFVFGSLCAFAVSFLFQSFTLQLIVFVIGSGVSLYFARPVATKFLLKKTVPTNADSLIGKTCVVTCAITPLQPGRVKIEGLTWLAKSDVPLQENETCIIKEITGVTLIVAPVTAQQSEPVVLC